MNTKSDESLEAVYIYIYIYIYIIFTKHQNWRKDWRESRNLKNEGFISSVKKLYIKYSNIKINLIENKKRQTDDKCVMPILEFLLN